MKILKEHNGMRPQDVIVLLKIISLNKADFKLTDLAQSLGISLSEVSDSISRSVYANLIAPDKKTPMRKAIYDFVIYGLPYVFPARPGALVIGVPTAHSAPPLSAAFGAVDPVVWPDPDGTIRGQEISPFHPKQPYAAKLDIRLYEMLALIDALRIGKTREKKIAKEELKHKILHESSH
jgi:hypothetical protein